MLPGLVSYSDDITHPNTQETIMSFTHSAGVSEEVLAELTSAAYHVVLRHGGVASPFIDVELDLWRELRRVLTATPVDRLQALSVRGS